MSTTDVVKLLQRAIAAEPATFVRDGGVIADGYDAELDELRTISTHTDEFLLELERRERERTGIAGLKLGYNRVQGFFIEITRKDAERVPKDYIRRQTVKSAERFITAELEGLRGEGAERARPLAGAREGTLRSHPDSTHRPPAAPCRPAAMALAELDALAALAERACSLGMDAAASWSLKLPAHRRRPAPGRGAFLRRAVRAERSAARCRPHACSSSPDPTWAVNQPTCARRR